MHGGAARDATGGLSNWHGVRVRGPKCACLVAAVPVPSARRLGKFHSGKKISPPPPHGNFRTPTEISGRRRGAARAARRLRPRLGARPACSREAGRGLRKFPRNLEKFQLELFRPRLCGRRLSSFVPRPRGTPAHASGSRRRFGGAVKLPNCPTLRCRRAFRAPPRTRCSVSIRRALRALEQT